MFIHIIYLIDASTIDLCLNLSPCAKFRTAKGGIRLHVKLDHSGNDRGKYPNIYFDQIIKMKGLNTEKDCKHNLRIIESYDPEADKTITLLTTFPTKGYLALVK